jgi:hypothetical protein
MEQNVIDSLGKKNRGIKYERTAFTEPGLVNREKAFADFWAEENDRKKRRGVNSGWGILQDHFFEKQHPLSMLPPQAIWKVTNRERVIVATIVQWLGSNVGWCFLGECLKRCGYKIVKAEQPPQPDLIIPHNKAGDWPEDFSGENGNYMNRCRVCENEFMGHKYRRVCKVCGQPPISNEQFCNELAKRWPAIHTIQEVFHNEFYGVNWLHDELTKPKG